MLIRPINMQIKSIKEPEANTIMQNGRFTIADYATAFIDGLGETQRSRFKQMLENNINCGMSVAKSYGVSYEAFIKEVKKQMGVDK